MSTQADYFARTPRPALLVLDEAFDGLDAASREELRAAVAAASADEETTILQIAHRAEDLVDPTKAVILGGEGGTAVVGAWHDVAAAAAAVLDREALEADASSTDPRGPQISPDL